MRTIGTSDQRSFLRIEAAIHLATFFFTVVAHRLFFDGIVQVLHKPTGAIDILDLVSLSVTAIDKRLKDRATRFKALQSEHRIDRLLPRGAETEKFTAGKRRRIGLVLVRPARHIIQVDHLAIGNRKCTRTFLDDGRIPNRRGLLRFPVAFKKSLAQFLVQRRRNRHLDGRIDIMLRIRFAKIRTHGILHVERLFKTFLHTSFASLSLFLGADNPQTRIDRNLDRFRVSLRFQGRIHDTFQGIDGLGITTFAFQQQVGNHFGTGVHRLGIRADLGSVTVRKLRRTIRKRFIRHCLENFFVYLDGIVCRELATIDFFGFALLDHILRGNHITRINSVTEFCLGKSRRGHARAQRAQLQKNFSKNFHLTLTYYSKQIYKSRLPGANITSHKINV